MLRRKYLGKNDHCSSHFSLCNFIRLRVWGEGTGTTPYETLKVLTRIYHWACFASLRFDSKMRSFNSTSTVRQFVSNRVISGSPPPQQKEGESINFIFPPYVEYIRTSQPHVLPVTRWSCRIINLPQIPFLPFSSRKFERYHLPEVSSTGRFEYKI